jgi:hypothetical protein
VASVPEGAERDRLYAQQAAQIPVFARYQEMTTRQIPVVVFDRHRAHSRTAQRRYCRMRYATERYI